MRSLLLLSSDGRRRDYPKIGASAMNIGFWRKSRELKYPLISIFLRIIFLCFIGFDLRCPSGFKRNPDLTQVAPDFGGDCRKPLWSPKSNDIFFLVQDSEEWAGLWRVILGEEPQRLLEGTFLNFDISPDETKVVLVKGTEYTERSLVLYDMEEETTQAIELSSKYSFDVSFSSNGNKIFYTISDELSSYYSFWVKSFLNNGEEKAIIESNVGSGDFDISLGDSLVIFREACYNINYSPPQKVSEGQYQAQFHSQKPDWIAYFPMPDAPYIHFRNIYTEVQDSIDVRPYLYSWFYDGPAWSPGGSKIVFSCASVIRGMWETESWIINNVDKYVK